ncbi:double-strand break repair helicase AddA [Kiloniella laminariae]|uniref:DNA 3'-5' helicase n=1 Tax=Kiloniella laminariae TaxID=454162 RepID=A0ABT4LJU8_9PROT|nr:double-strand break repair helicase AddA [Kiloniella laminariae]MCZ4281379.1 double-strand break repair helicase AddA [Kiloniella laminariae]
MSIEQKTSPAGIEEILDKATGEQRQAADPTASVWVGASAGAGKTKVLTDRILNLLLSGSEPGKILALTFTKAAAAEMANRLSGKLAQWSTIADEALLRELSSLLGRLPSEAEAITARRLFARVLDTPGGMKIQTIHAFCQSLLGRFPLEAGVAPNFQILDDRSAAELLTRAREDVLSGRGGVSEEEVTQALSCLTAYTQEQSFGPLVQEIIRERGRISILLQKYGNLSGLKQAVHKVLDAPEDVGVEELLLDACSDRLVNVIVLGQAADALLQGAKSDQERGRVLKSWLEADPQVRRQRYTDYTGVFFTQAGEPRSRLATKGALAVLPDLPDILMGEIERLIRVNIKCNAIAVAEATIALLLMGVSILKRYERYKEARAFLDYDDLILKARDLLRGERAVAWVLFKLDGGLDHVLIDEAQDTNPEQWDVVGALCEEFFTGEGARDVVRTIFAVGDVKQSIYSFQRADPAKFEEMRRYFQQKAVAAEQKLARISLDVSFRSTPAVLGVVDQVFASAVAADGVSFESVPLNHQPVRLGQAGRVELWPLIASEAAGEETPWTLPLAQEAEMESRARLAMVLARRIHYWTRSEAGATDPLCQLPAKGRRIRPGDVLILVRRRNAFVEELVRELKVLSVPVSGVDRMVLTDQMAVMDLIALGRFLLLPDDDLTLATVLKGPMLGLREEQLFALAHNRKGTLWSVLRDRARQDADCARAAGFLNGLLARADYTPPFELISHILGPLGGRKKLLARLGPDARDPIEEFLSLALVYEREETPSLEGFLHWLEAGEQEIKRDLEQGGDAVRIMTVHGSKGLQAPLVILPDTTQIPQADRGVLWLREQDNIPVWSPRAALQTPVISTAREALRKEGLREYRRLLYVALTRAEDRLVICGWCGQREPSEDSWYALAKAALSETAEEENFAFPEDPTGPWDARGWLVENPQTAEVKRTSGERAEETALQALPQWAFSVPEQEPVPPKPLAPSRRKDDEPPVRSPLGDGDDSRFRRGLLIHRLLQTLPELEPDKWAESARRFLSSPLHELSEVQITRLQEETLSVLGHPEYQALFGPDSRAEVPVVGLVRRDGDVEVISGQVDRLVITEKKVIIIDYKTNRPPPLSVEKVHRAYLRQMAAYRMILQQIYPDHEIEVHLLWTDDARLMLLPDSILAQHAP